MWCPCVWTTYISETWYPIKKILRPLFLSYSTFIIITIHLCLIMSGESQVTYALMSCDFLRNVVWGNSPQCWPLHSCVFCTISRRERDTKWAIHQACGVFQHYLKSLELLQFLLQIAAVFFNYRIRVNSSSLWSWIWHLTAVVVMVMVGEGEGEEEEEEEEEERG